MERKDSRMGCENLLDLFYLPQINNRKSWHTRKTQYNELNRPKTRLNIWANKHKLKLNSYNRSGKLQHKRLLIEQAFVGCNCLEKNCPYDGMCVKVW